MNKKSAIDSTLVYSYLAHRKAIGILGIALPFVVSLGALIIFQTGIQGSLSGYYYTGMRDVFVGTLWAIGFFLLSYKGYERADDIAGNLSCLFAVGVSLFPTAPRPCDLECCTHHWVYSPGVCRVILPDPHLFLSILVYKD